jgi:hypothetical protein
LLSPFVVEIEEGVPPETDPKQIGVFIAARDGATGEGAVTTAATSLNHSGSRSLYSTTVPFKRELRPGFKLLLTISNS